MPFSWTTAVPTPSPGTLMRADRGPRLPGVNRTFTMAVAPGLRILLEATSVVLWKSAASSPSSRMSPMRRGALPALVTRTACSGLGMPTRSDPKSMLPGLALTTPTSSGVSGSTSV
jgi:hypothetical protein